MSLDATVCSRDAAARNRLGDAEKASFCLAKHALPPVAAWACDSRCGGFGSPVQLIALSWLI